VRRDNERCNVNDEVETYIWALVVVFLSFLYRLIFMVCVQSCLRAKGTESVAWNSSRIMNKSSYRALAI
jgi:hypothetical protein